MQVPIFMHTQKIKLYDLIDRFGTSCWEIKILAVENGPGIQQ